MTRENKKNKKIFKVLGVVLRTLLLLFLSALIFLVFYIPRTDAITGSRADKYASRVFPKIALFFNSISNITMNSISELVVIVGSVTLLIVVVYVIVLLIVKIVKGGFWKFFYKVLATVLTATFVLSLIFQLMHGINYRRTPIEERLGFEGENWSVEEIIPVYIWARDEMIAARSKLGTDCFGVTHMSTSFEETVLYANSLINSASDYFGLGLSENYVRAKPVSLSHYWSYTHITGMYNPFFGEANVNVDCKSLYQYPQTIMHEILHAKGVARENECNLLATLMCCLSERPDFRYAGFLEIYYDLNCILFSLGYQLEIDEGAAADISAYMDYWSSLENNDFTQTVAEVAETTNDTYLKSNDQEEGTQSYIINENYYIDFYYTYIYPKVGTES